MSTSKLAITWLESTSGPQCLLYGILLLEMFICKKIPHLSVVTPSRKTSSCKTIFTKLSGTWLSCGNYGVYVAICYRVYVRLHGCYGVYALLFFYVWKEPCVALPGQIYMMHHAIPRGYQLCGATLRPPGVKSCIIIWCVIQREHILENRCDFTWFYMLPKTSYHAIYTWNKSFWTFYCAFYKDILHFLNPNTVPKNKNK